MLYWILGILLILTLQKHDLYARTWLLHSFYHQNYSNCHLHLPIQFHQSRQATLTNAERNFHSMIIHLHL